MLERTSVTTRIQILVGWVQVLSWFKYSVSGRHKWNLACWKFSCSILIVNDLWFYNP